MPEEEEQRPTYRKVKDAYDNMKARGLITQSLPEWSAEMNRATNSELFSAGLNDNIIKRASVQIDRILEATHLPAIGKQLGGDIGALVGSREYGEMLGEGTPRAIVNMAPFLIPGAGWGAGAARLGITAGRVAATRLGLTGLLTGAGTYTETGSPVAGVVSGGMAMAIPKVADVGEQLVAKKLGARMLGERYIPETFGAKAATFAGGQVASTGFMEAEQAAESVVQGRVPDNPFTTDMLLDLTLGQAPFAAIHGINKARGNVPNAETLKKALDIEERNIAEKKAAKENEGTAIRQEPINPNTYRDTQAALAKVRGELAKTPVTNIDEINGLLQQEREILQQHEKQGASLFGDTIKETSPRQQVIGTEVRSNSKSRSIKVSDSPVNPEELRGKIVTYSTAYEPNPVNRSTGDTVYSLPDTQWRTAKTQEEWDLRKTKAKQVDPNQPELPDQEIPGSEEIYYSHVQDLKKVEAAADGITNLAEGQQAVVELQHVQHEADVPVTTDRTLGPLVKKLTGQGVDPNKAVGTAIKIETKRTGRRIAAKRQKPLTTEEKAKAKAEKKLEKALSKSLREEERATEEPTAEEISEVTEKMGGRRFQVQTPDTLSHNKESAAPVSRARGLGNIVEENAAKILQPYRDRPELAEDARTFMTAISEMGSITDAAPEDFADTVQFIADRDEISLEKAQEKVDVFLKSPHAQEWSAKLDEQLAKVRETNAAPANILRPVPGERLVTVRRPDGTTYHASYGDRYVDGPGGSKRESIARQTPDGKWEQGALHPTEKIIEPYKVGSNWLLSMASYDFERRLLGGKHPVQPSGYMRESTFRNIGGQFGKPLAKAELEFYRKLVPAAFSDGEVSIPILSKGLKESGPQLKLQELTPHKYSKAEKAELSELTSWRNQLTEDSNEAIDQVFHDHEYFGRVNEPIWAPHVETLLRSHGFNDENIKKAKRYVELQEKNDKMFRKGTNTFHETVGPKHPLDMPEYVELLVQIPLNEADQRRQDAGMLLGDATGDAEDSVYFQGGHFGRHDVNVLAHVRGYMETLPNGERAFHVIEIQGDWAQDQKKLRKYREQWNPEIKSVDQLPEGWIWDTPSIGDPHALKDSEGMIRGQTGKTKEAVLEYYNRIRKENLGRGEHPLLEVYESMAVKTAIQHAKAQGANKIIFSDAETAMLTQGHHFALNTKASSPEDVVRILNQDGRLEASLHQDEDGARFIRIKGHKGQSEEYLESPERGIGLVGVVRQMGVNDTLALFPEARPTQELGMRLHYDKFIPKMAENLTGTPGEYIDLGEHKQSIKDEDVETFDTIEEAEDRVAQITKYDRAAKTEIRRVDDEGSQQGHFDVHVYNLEGVDLFKPEEGPSKTNISGRMYDIGHLPSDFTVSESHRAPDVTPYEPGTQAEADQVSRLGLERKGQGLTDSLKDSVDPLVQETYQRLGAFKDSLGRIDVVVGDTTHGGPATFDSGDGRVRIVIAPEILSAKNRDLLIAHELVHGVTLSEMNDPTNAPIVRELDGLRQKLIESLSEKHQEQLKFLEKTEWYKQHAEGTASYASILPDGTASERAVLYGLLNAKEMVAQGFSSKPMRDFMKKAGKGGWEKFVDKIKQMLGFNTDSKIFGEFLDKTESLMQQGDFVASFREFAERHYENQGMSDIQTQRNVRRALVVISDSSYGTTKEEILSRLNNDPTVKSPELVSAEKSLNIAMSKNAETRLEYENYMREAGHELSVKGANDFVHEYLMGRQPDQRAAIDMMPQDLQNYVFTKIKDMDDVLSSLDAATQEENRGLLNLTNPDALRGPVTEAVNSTKGLVEVQNAHKLGEQLIHEAQAMMPDVYVDRYGVQAPKVDEISGNPGWFGRQLMQMSRLVRMYPVTAELADRAYEVGPNAANMKSNILRVLGVDLRSEKKALSKEGLAVSVKAISTPKTLRAVNDWMYWNNQIAKAEKRGVTLLPTSHPMVQTILDRLSPEERTGVIDTLAKQVHSTQVAQKETLEKMGQVGVALSANIAVKDAKHKTQKAVEIAQELFDALMLDRTDPTNAMKSDAKIANVQKQLTPEGFLEMLTNTQKETEKFKLWKEYFTKNPAWATAQRLERYLVTFKRGGRSFQLQASSHKEAKKLMEGGTPVGEGIIDNWKGKEDLYPDLGPDAIGIIKRIQELEQEQLQALKSRGYLDEDAVGWFEKMSVATQLARETAAAGAGGGVPTFRAPPRLLSKGAEELPWFWNHVAHAERISNFWSRKLLRAQATLHLSDPELQANPMLHGMMKQHIENVLSQDPRLTQAVTRFASTWFMGFSPASAMMNGFQTISTAVPEMTAINGGKMIESYKRWGHAVAEVVKQARPGGKWSTENLDWFAKRMSEDHEWEYSMYSDDAEVSEIAATNHKRVMMKQKPQNIGQRLITAAGIYTKTGMWMFRSVERTNNKIASVMAFEHFMAEGMTREEALVEAKRFNRAVNYTGGRANRSVGIFAGDSTVHRSAAMLATNMQGYNLGVVGQIADYLQKGAFRPPGITPSEVYGARKAGLQMLATQLTAAGALGLPFASGLISLLNSLFPGLEINKNVREWAREFFESDNDEQGGILGQIALTGLPSMLGWDMHSRLSMGNIVPGTSEYNGFQPETLLGPPVNMITNYAEGGKKLAAGDTSGGWAFVPPGVRKVFQYWMNENTMKDYKDRPLFKPSMGEAAGLALGFQPKQLSDYNAANRILQQNREVAVSRENQFHSQQAEEVLKGNFGNIRQKLVERSREDKAYKPEDAVREIARHAEDLTYPRDLRREGTRSTGTARERLLETFNVPLQNPSEVDRLKFRLGVEQRLGLRSTEARQRIRTAQLVDQLQKENPTMTRSQLLQLAAERQRRRPTSSFHLE